MQNIEAILSELGIEVPADKKGDLTKKVLCLSKTQQNGRLRLRRI